MVHAAGSGSPDQSAGRALAARWRVVGTLAMGRGRPSPLTASWRLGLTRPDLTGILTGPCLYPNLTLDRNAGPETLTTGSMVHMPVSSPVRPLVPLPALLQPICRRQHPCRPQLRPEHESEYSAGITNPPAPSAHTDSPRPCHAGNGMLTGRHQANHSRRGRSTRALRSW